MSACTNNKENDLSIEDVHSVTIKSTTFQNYWVKFHNGKIEIGRTGESSPFLSFSDNPNIKEEEHKNVVKEEVTSEKTNNESEISAEWKPISDGVIPENAVFAGNDPNCPLFVGRAYYEGDLLPGKICLSNKLCYVPWGGLEHAKNEYEVLIGRNYEWVPYQDKSILINAVPGGMTKDGSTLYIGRTNYNNTVTPGKIYPLTGLIYIPYGGLERTFRSFDILIFKSKCT